MSHIRCMSDTELLAAWNALKAERFRYRPFEGRSNDLAYIVMEARRRHLPLPD